MNRPAAPAAGGRGCFHKVAFMMRAKSLIALAGAFVLGSMLAVGSPDATAAFSFNPTPASDTGAGGAAPAAPTTTVAGTIQSIDPFAGFVTIRNADGLSIKLVVGSKTLIDRNGSPTDLTGLTLNDSVIAQYRAPTLTLTQLSASGPPVTTTIGTASAVSIGAATVTVGGTSLQTNPGTKIARNGQIVGLRQITLKDTLVGHATPGTNIALDVQASGPKENEVHGTITGISGSDVTITPSDGSVPVTITVGPDTRIEIDDQPGALADLATGQCVEAGYDPTTLAALSIEVGSCDAEEQSVQGTVAGVDTTAGTVTITPKGGGPDVTLLVDATTKIQVNDVGAALGDLAAGMPVEAEYDPVTMLARKIDAGGPDDEAGNEDQGGTQGTTETDDDSGNSGDTQDSAGTTQNGIKPSGNAPTGNSPSENSTGDNKPTGTAPTGNHQSGTQNGTNSGGHDGEQEDQNNNEGEHHSGGQPGGGD